MNREYANKLKIFADKLATDAYTSESDIKIEMEKLGLIYCTDEIERLNRVLLALHPISEQIKLEQNNQQELNH